MKFNVTGADRDTGADIQMTVDAADEASAQEVAHRKGIMVSRISPALVERAQAIRSVTPEIEQGHHRGAPILNIAPPRRGSSLGVASLILGILAFVICWIPLVNLLGVPLSALGLILGAVGVLVAFTRRGASIGYPIAGAAISGLSLVVAISITGLFVGGLKKASDEMASESRRRNATNQMTAAPVKPRSGTPDTLKPLTSGPVVPAPQAKPEWAAAETPVRQGDVQVRVKGVRVGKVPLKDRIGDGHGESKETLLTIDLEVTNLSETKKLDYRTWGARSTSFGSRTALTDNFDNRYKVVDFGFGNDVVGAIRSESVYPGKSVQDVLVFEEPIAKVEHLNLELPASQFGGEGMLRIRIPASMIQR